MGVRKATTEGMATVTTKRPRGPAQSVGQRVRYRGEKGGRRGFASKVGEADRNGVRTQGRSFDLAKVIWYFSISNPYANADHDQDAF